MNKAQCIEYVKAHLEVRYATENGAFTAGRKIKPSGLLNHSVGCAQPNPEVFFNLMNKSSCGWGVTALIGGFNKGEGKIILALPMNQRNWGCGTGKKGSWNNSHIQWEICEPAGHTYAGGTMIGYDVQKNQEYFDRMWKLVVAWNVYMCDYFGLDPNTITDHAGAYKAGYGSNHCDVGQWWPKHGKSVAKLQEEVKAILNGLNPSSRSKSEMTAPCTVCTTAGSGLNIRTEPKTGKVVGKYAYDTKVYITEISNGWGKTSDGWISLDYAVLVEEDVLDMTKTELEKLIDERIEKAMEKYETVAQLPTYWQQDIKDLIKMDVINGGTDNKVNDQDVNLNKDTIKAIVILKRYVDTILGNK